MKNFITKAKIFLALMMSVFIVTQCSSTKNANLANDKLSPASVKNMIDSQKFVFIADDVNPLNGGHRTLTTLYYVSVATDSLVSDLPYFGRAYIAPIDPSKGGIQFTATNFSYEVTQAKNNRWDISVKPKDVRDVQQLNFTIFDNGSASLVVTNTSRDPISFNGHLK